MKRFAALAALAVLVPVLPARADNETARPIKVPFELIKSQHIIVKVKVNGEGPFTLIFDTGAPVTLINNKLAKAGKVFPKGFRPPFFALFGAMGEFPIKTLEVGGVKAHDIPAVVMNHPTVEAISKFVGPIEGIVGFSFFARYHLSIDYQAKVMTFVPTTYRPPNLVNRVERLLSGDRSKAVAKVLAPAGQWGLRVGKESSDEAAGVTVKEVLPGTPAAAAGLKAGDRLLVLDGRWTDSVADCYEAASHVRPGTEARVTVRRDGQERELTVKVRNGL
jgi:hypothetical protein